LVPAPLSRRTEQNRLDIASPAVDSYRQPRCLSVADANFYCSL